MAKKIPAKDESAETSAMLPVPEPVIRHHGSSVFAPMREWKQQGRIPPVLLMTGTAGSGKRSLSYWMAQWILCEKNGFARKSPEENSDEDPFTMSMFGEAPAAPAPQSETPVIENGDPGPCGECPSCVRASKGNWVDFTEVLPEDSDGESTTSGTLKVEQFRKIKATLGFGAHEGAFKIILIPNADRMTAQAANSVLKLLEEPPQGWLFFLTAGDPTLVLPTILSRCQTLRLKPFAVNELKELLALSGVEPKRQEICAVLGQGSWSKALALANDEIWEHRKVLFNFLRDPGSQLNALVDWASQAPSHFDLLVDQLEQLTSELIRWSLAPAAYTWLSADGTDSLSQHAKAALKRQGSVEAARDFWIDRAERLARVRQEALAPLNRKLLVQDLLLPWLQAM